MTLAYVDTSAFLKFFLNEPEAPEVVAAAKRADELWALRLVLTEARITLERARKDGRLTQEAFAELGETVSDFWDQEMQVVELVEETYVAAERIASRQPGLRTLDALHVAAARLMGKALPQAQVAMLACDVRLLKAAEAVGIPITIPAPPSSDVVP